MLPSLEAPATRWVGDEGRKSELRASLNRDWGEMFCWLTAAESKLESGRRSTQTPGRLERGVKNLVKRLGVTEGILRSLRRSERVGERKEFGGGEGDRAAGGLDGMASAGPKW